jgi:hypothetical protein
MPSPTAELFLDTSYAIALSAPTDQHHERAVEQAQRIEAGSVRLVTTRAVVLEIGNALSKRRYRTAAIALLDAIEHDPIIDVVPLSEALYALAADPRLHVNAASGRRFRSGEQEHELHPGAPPFTKVECVSGGASLAPYVCYAHLP